MPRSINKDGLIELADELKILNRVSRAIQEAGISEESYEEILKIAGEIIDFRSASLFLFSKEDGKLKEVCTIGHRVDLINFVEFDMGTGISAWVAQKRRPILLKNLRKSTGGVSTRSFLSVPIVFSDQIMGVINLAHDEPEAFTCKDADILGIISSLFALLSERVSHKKSEACMLAEIDSLNEQLKNTRMEISRMDNVCGIEDISAPLSDMISNSLAIIAGNAQFLLMTMKNSSGSVIRRLKAIDKEAANILMIVNHYASKSRKANEFSKKPEESFAEN